MSTKSRKSEKQKQIEAEYRKQRKRIQNYINVKKKQGFEVDFDIPKIPKTITKGSVARLSKITPSKIQKSIIYKVADISTGEIINLSYSEAQQVKKQKDTKHKVSISQPTIEHPTTQSKETVKEKEPEELHEEIQKSDEDESIYLFDWDKMQRAYEQYLRTRIAVRSSETQEQRDVMAKVVSSLAAMAVEIDRKEAGDGNKWLENIGILHAGMWYDDSEAVAVMEQAAEAAQIDINFEDSIEQLLDNENWGMGYLPFNYTDN